MDYKVKLEELKKQRDAIVGQIMPALQQVAYLDGQIALLQEMMKLEEKKQSDGQRL